MAEKKKDVPWWKPDLSLPSWGGKKEGRLLRKEVDVVEEELGEGEAGPVVDGEMSQDNALLQESEHSTSIPELDEINLNAAERKAAGTKMQVLPGITHIKLPGSKQRTILDESHRSITHGCRQPSNQAHKTISRRGELAAPGSGGGFHHVCTPFKLLRARTSPLVASLHL